MRWQKIRNYLAYTIGHRGSFLILLALAFIFYGVGVIRENAAYDIYPYRWISWDQWGYIWIATGLAAFAGAFMTRDRVPFMTATVVSGLWTIRWFAVSFEVPHASIWSTALTWVVITGIILIVSTWPEVHIRFDRDEPKSPPDIHIRE